MAEKNKSGAGKFFLGALLGAAAGTIAGRFISAKADEEEECDCDEKCECGENCKCGEDCKCGKDKKSDKKAKKEE